ncbi:SufE family protein [Marinomonas sp. 15G1-11]|uniref:SufE family protein n=1 Tax=Marinomonas phaeophyticola TaxID=3004091 RepID=A0ABT4JUB3_9GAMM|nr:SufE family protein [Marinomonas sp. 15G1-11]MCZ2721811.1 SufE family protein [Marinomonas sp. 15G1-11]
MESPSLSSIQAQLQACHSKEDTFRTLVTLSKTLPRLSNDEKADEHKIKGCESAVWLIIEHNHTDFPQFKADSDAKLMRGVLAAILSLVNGKSTTEIQAMDLSSLMSSLNLGSYLTSSRTNGVLAILDKISCR